MVKSPEEVVLLERSSDLIECSVDAMYRTARPGVRESEVYAWMLWEQVANGGDMPTLLSWLSGPWGRMSQRLLQATTRVLQNDDMNFNEIESRYGGYCAQQVQPMCLGRIPAQRVIRLTSQVSGSQVGTRDMRLETHEGGSYGAAS